MVAINPPRYRARAARPAHHRGSGAHKAGAEKVTLPRTHARRPADGARQPSRTSAMPSWDFWFRVWTFCHFPCNEAAYNLQPLPHHCSAHCISSPFNSNPLQLQEKQRTSLGSGQENLFMLLDKNNCFLERWWTCVRLMRRRCNWDTICNQGGALIWQLDTI